MYRLSVAALLALVAIGCQSPRAQRDGAGQKTILPGVAPLTEAEFDTFAGQLSEEILQTFQTPQASLPALVAAPRIARNDAEDANIAVAFADRLADGLSDRLGGAVTVVRERRKPTSYHTWLSFERNQVDPAQRIITFTLADIETQRVLVRDSFQYVPRAVFTAAHVAQPPPIESSFKPASVTPQPDARDAAIRERIRRSQEIEIDIDDEPTHLAALIFDQAQHYRANTVSADDGAVIFLDDESAERFLVLDQRRFRTTDGKLRVEIDLRTRRKERSVDVRIIFLDAQNQQLAVTPVIPYDFVSYFTKTVIATSDSPDAVRYIMLLQD